MIILYRLCDVGDLSSYLVRVDLIWFGSLRFGLTWFGLFCYGLCISPPDSDSAFWGAGSYIRSMCVIVDGELYVPAKSVFGMVEVDVAVQLR